MTVFLRVRRQQRAADTSGGGNSNSGGTCEARSHRPASPDRGINLQGLGPGLLRLYLCGGSRWVATLVAHDRTPGQQTRLQQLAVAARKLIAARSSEKAGVKFPRPATTI